MASFNKQRRRKSLGSRRRLSKALLVLLQTGTVAAFSACSSSRAQHACSPFTAGQVGFRSGTPCAIPTPRCVRHDRLSALLPVGSATTSYRTNHHHHHHHHLLAAASSASDIVPDNNNIDNESLTPPPKFNYEWGKQNVAIALPALIGMLADPLLSLMDTAYVGRVGSTELAALGACTSIFHLAFNAFRATTAATTSLVATSLQDDPEQAKQVTAVSLQLGWWMGVAVTLILLATGNAALGGMGVPASSALYKPASEYLFTRCWAAPVVLLIGVAEGAFRGYGDTITPALASLTAALMNLVLDPLLIFFPLNWGVRGAAAATAMAQMGAAAVYGWKLVQKKMLPSSLPNKNGGATAATAATTLAAAATVEAGIISSPTELKPALKRKSKWIIVRTILGANLAMLMKQGSLLLAWAVATARATRLGAEHVASHQVLLSVWLVFALILDGAAVSAQVLSSRAYAAKDHSAVKSLTKYMVTFAVVQGLISMLVADCLDFVVPGLFTPDPVIQAHLHKLMPVLAWQQVLVSLTLVVESLAVGASQFKTLAIGTAAATVVSIWQLARQTSVEGIWNSGIISLFCGRLITAIYACARAQHKLRRDQEESMPGGSGGKPGSSTGLIAEAA